MPADPIAKVDAPDAGAGGRPKRFLAAILVAALLCSAGVLAVNYTVDPRNAFPPDHFKPLWKDTYMDRLRTWQAMEPAPAIVIFGSSTSLHMEAADAAVITNRTAFNFAAPGSGPEDYLPVYDFMVKQGRAPQDIVVGVDDFLFLDVYWNRAILPGSAAYRPVVGHSPPLSHTIGDLRSSFNPGYLLDSLRVLQYTYVTGYPHARPEGEAVAGAADLGDLLGPGVIGIFEGQYQPDVHVSAAKELAFGTLLAHAAAANTTVRLVLPPIHPDVLDLVDDSADYARIHGNAVDLTRAACGPRVRVHDFTKLEAFGGDPSAFSNAWHYTGENGRRMLAAAYTTPGVCG